MPELCPVGEWGPGEYPSHEYNDMESVIKTDSTPLVFNLFLHRFFTSHCHFYNPCRWALVMDRLRFTMIRRADSDSILEMERVDYIIMFVCS